jgi:hypothetical protein
MNVSLGSEPNTKGEFRVMSILQHMQFPENQDVIDHASILGWTSGPLPDSFLEGMARELFRFKFPHMSPDSSLCTMEMDECRQMAIRFRVKCLTMDRVNPAIGSDTPDWQVPPNTDIREAQWRDAFFAAQLANVTCLHIWGIPLLRVKPAIRIDVRGYADTFTEDIIERYASVLNVQEGK